MQVNLENNKYSLIFNETTGTLLANRYGEHWMDYSGNKFVYLLLARIVELESNQAQMLKSLEWFVENDDTNIGMPGNEFWEDGLNEGVKVIALVKGEV